MIEQDDVVHLVNKKRDWQLWETADGALTDGRAREDLQRDRVHQMQQWLQHFPERLPDMEALTRDGQEALRRARAKRYPDEGTRW